MSVTAGVSGVWKENNQTNWNKKQILLIKKLITISCSILLLSAAGRSQSTTPEERYLQSRVEQRKLDRNKWAELVDGWDYSERSARSRKRERDPGVQGGENRPSMPVFGEGAGAAVARFFLIIIGAVLIALLIRSILGYGKAKNKKIRRDADEGIDIKKIEENIHEADMESFIRLAKEAGDFNLAIRLYYLAILKELSLQKAIKWKIDKTNNEYLREMRDRPEYTELRDLTLVFERSWYGDHRLDAATFARLEPPFRQFIDRLVQQPQAISL